MFSLVWTAVYLIYSQNLFTRLWKIRTRFSRSFLFEGLMIVCFGSFLWSCGSLIWSGFNLFLRIEIPFPSYPDILYISGSMLVMAGCLHVCRYFLGADSGSSTSIRKENFFVNFVICSFCLVGLFALRGNISLLRTVLNVLYVLIDSASVLLLLVPLFIGEVSPNNYKLHTMLKPYMLMLGAVAFMFFGDLLFLLSTLNGNFHNGGVGDMLFFSYLATMSLSIMYFMIELYPPLANIGEDLSSSFILHIPTVRQISLNYSGFGVYFALAFGFHLGLLLVFFG